MHQIDEPIIPHDAGNKVVTAGERRSCSATATSQQAIYFADGLKILDKENQERNIYFTQNGSHIHQPPGGNKGERILLTNPKRDAQYRSHE
jgi:hypothetical protein